MKNKTALLIVIFSISLNIANGQWSTNPAVNTVISAAADSQLGTQIISDDAGGAIITWSDYRSGSNYDIYAQRISAAGIVQWTTNGVAICTSANRQAGPQIIPDGAGGAIIAWTDYRNGSNADIYCQRINAAGLVQWAIDGVAMCTATGDQQYSIITPDGAGGAIVSWHDYRSATNYDIYAQRINAAGIVQWTTNGQAICTAAAMQYDPTLVSDELGGAIITWHDYRNGISLDIYAQRINAAGQTQWTANGILVCGALKDQAVPTIISDGSNGAIVFWEDYRNASWIDIYAQRINAAGQAQWTSDGIVICNAPGSQQTPTEIADGAGGAFVTWQDIRGVENDIYAQRINADGIAQWANNGEAVCTAAGHQVDPVITSNGSGGVIISWLDNRIGTNPDIYAQLISASGQTQWTTDGVIVSNAPNGTGLSRIVSDNSGGAIIAWDDNRNLNGNDIYAQNICAGGLLGSNQPSAPGSITGLSSICPGSSATYGVTPVVNATYYNWVLPVGWTGTSTTDSITVTAGSTGGLISVTASNACGTSATSVQNIAVKNSSATTISQISCSSYTLNSQTYTISGVYTQLLTNTAGCDSIITLNLTINNPVNQVQTITLCAGDSITIGANTYYATVLLTDTLAAFNGCDSILSTNLIVNDPIDKGTTLNGLAITSNQTGGSYQWIDCNSNLPIPNETNQSFVATADGDYAVIVTVGPCSDTSDCVNILLSGSQQLSNNNLLFNIYPNPTSGNFIINTANGIDALFITNTLGETLIEIKPKGSVTELTLEDFSDGIYFVKIIFKSQTKMARIIKTK